MRRALVAGGVTAVAALSLAASASATVTTIRPPSGAGTWATFDSKGEVLRLYDHHTNDRYLRVYYTVYEPEAVWGSSLTTDWQASRNLDVYNGSMVKLKACDYSARWGLSCSREVEVMA